MKMYLRFAAMIVTSTAIMFGLMYITAYRWDHVLFSETRFFMALIMGGTMSIVMLSYMLNMYKNRKVNVGIYVFSAALLVLAIWLARSQETVQDVAWMKAMIPHHSIAILTSERAELSDPRVQELASKIIEAQRQEIAQMKALIEDLQNER